MFYVLFFVSLAFAVARFVVPVEGAINPADIFKDAAHLWVGVLFGFAAAVSWVNNRATIDEVSFETKWWSLPIALTVVEVVAFFVRSDG